MSFDRGLSSATAREPAATGGSHAVLPAFAGGMAGYLAGTVKTVHFNDLRKAMIYGSVLASFCVEAFSLERLRNLSVEEIAKPYEMFKLMSQFEVPQE